MLEQQINALWWGKQTAKGTPLVAPSHRAKQVTGDMNLPRQDGSVAYSDLSKHGNIDDWVDQLVGNGDPGILATPEELSSLLWAFQGGETTAAVTGPPAKTKHTVVPLPGLGHWLTVFARKGQTQIMRHQYADSMISQAVIEGSTAQKDVRITPSIISLDPAIVKTADPAAAQPTKVPFLYTDGVGAFTIDTVVFKGHSQFTLTLNDDLQPVYGDDVTVQDLAPGDPTITIGCTVLVDADGLAQFNKLVYGSATPAADTKPLRRLPALGSYSFYLKAKDSAGALNGDEFKLTMPSVKWAVPDAPGPNTGGGAAQLALAGAPRNSGSPLYTIDVSNDAVAHTV